MGAYHSREYQYHPLKKLKTDHHHHNDQGTINEPRSKNTGIRKSQELISEKTRVLKSRDLISGSPIVDDHYDRLNKISSGSYGAVRRARDKKTGEIVAIKKELDGKCLTSLREIEILKNLNRHPRIVEFKTVAVDNRNGLYVVMEYLESNLRQYIKYSEKIEAKGLMKQLLEGVKFLHDNDVMHRDLKPANILIKTVNGSDKLKICDFGLSRRFGGRVGPYTPLVGTLWYRAPELLLGAKRYSSAIDMWAVGCIMAELLLKEALFQGESEINQLVKIYEILGRPNKKVWSEFSSLPGSKCTLLSKRRRNVLRNKIPAAMLTKVGFDLLSKLLAYDPAKRITAEAALNHRWFRET